MSGQNLNLKSLIPDFSLLLTDQINSPDWISAAVVAILGVVFVGFLFWTMGAYFRAHRQLRFYEKLVKGLKVDDLIHKRREITSNAMEFGAYGQLWREFDESLVDLPQKERVCNTLDASHFFNTHTLAKGLTENRLIAAVPGFLTAIGVIGTFAGLQMGLGALDLKSGADTKELTEGIFGMIGGASVAFMTSVWGVVSSVLFNFIEKSLERRIRNAISNFQNKIDFLYPRITAEQSLSQIEEFSRQSTEKLGELDEKIGHRLQEAMRESTSAIQEGIAKSLNEVLAPAIQQLVNNAQSGSEKALDSMLTRFLDGMGNAGEEQRRMMAGASQELGEAAGNMTKGMDGFLEKLDSHIDAITQKNESALSEINQTFAAQLDAQQEKDSARQVVINDQMRRIDRSQQTLSENIEQMVHGQEEQFARIREGIEGVLTQFSTLIRSQEEATTAMRSVSGEMLGASNQLGVLSQNTREATALLNDTSEKLASTLVAVAEDNKRVLEGCASLRDSLATAGSSVDSSSQKLYQAAELAEAGFRSIDSHFSQLSQSLKEHVAQLEEQVGKLLSDYSTQVRAQTVERLNTWNEHTNQYTSEMTRAVQALSSVVDEIDSKQRRA